MITNHILRCFVGIPGDGAGVVAVGLAGFAITFAQCPVSINMAVMKITAIILK